MTVCATWKWPSNAELIEDAASLGYLRREWRTLDPTYGRGHFWRLWRPAELVASDIKTHSTEIGVAGHDFRALPYSSRSFDAVVYDPPYKLNGTPSGDDVDERYGVDVAMRWQDRMNLIRTGFVECARVLGNGSLLAKCQDQVCSGKVRWQSYDLIRMADLLGLELVDRFDMLGGRPQPEGRRQIHARRNTSSLLVFQRNRARPAKELW